MKLHEETAALGAFSVVGLAVVSLFVYFGFGSHTIGVLFGVVALLFGGLVVSVVCMQRRKQ